MKTAAEIFKERFQSYYTDGPQSLVPRNIIAAMEEYAAQFQTPPHQVERAEGWISVSERLPEENEIVLAIGTLTDEIDPEAHYNVTAIIEAHTKSERGGLEGYLINTHTYYTRLDRCTHWQPLPTPPTI